MGRLLHRKEWWQGETVMCWKCALPLPILAFGLIVLGMVLRLAYLGVVPGGMNQDEAYAGYEAYSMLHSGTDSWGYAFPVYFISWGSGMNVLNSYLMMPFVAVLGLCPLAVRLPQAIVACITLPVFYKMMRRIFGAKPALACLFLLAVCPWHIMMARWGLESNLAPGFLLLGLYFFLLGVDDSRKYLLSALFYGLSLYAYATIWPIVPLMLVLQLLYLLYTRKLKPDRYVLLSAVILLALALPLVLFLLINKGYMEEIQTGWFSIPRLICMRDSEISFAGMKDNLHNLWKLLMTQDDGLCWNTTPEYGLYYKGTAVFAVLGGAYCLKRTVQSLRKREYDGAVFPVISLVCAVFLGSLVSVNVNRINCIHIGIVGFSGIGLYLAIRCLQAEFRHIGVVLAAAFGAACLCFVRFYYTDYNDRISQVFHQGLGEAVEYVKEEFPEEQEVHVSGAFSYSLLLFYDRTPVEEFIETVEYGNYPAQYLSAERFGRYRFDAEYAGGEEVYLVPEESAEGYEAYGYQVKHFDTVCVAYK